LLTRARPPKRGPRSLARAPHARRLLSTLARREPAECLAFRKVDAQPDGMPPETHVAAQRLDDGVASAPEGGAGAGVAADGPDTRGCELASVLQRATAAESGGAPFHWDPLAFHSDRAQYQRVLHLIAALFVGIGCLGYMHCALKYAVD
jgi:hypothetical protein